MSDSALSTGRTSGSVPAAALRPPGAFPADPALVGLGIWSAVQSLLGLETPDEPDALETLDEQVRRGLPWSSAEAVRGLLDLDRTELAALLHVSERSLARRRKADRLETDESDRLVRLVWIVARAAEVLGTTDKASRWLAKPNRTLGAQRPLDLLDTETGVRRVDAVLTRLDHGVFG